MTNFTVWTPGEWAEEAACAGHPEPEIFTNRQAEALQVCDGCPVRKECLAYALSIDAYGVWGGTTNSGRKTMPKTKPRGAR